MGFEENAINIGNILKKEIPKFWDGKKSIIKIKNASSKHVSKNGKG